MEVTPRVLSIQSHVVTGYVGNKSACFPLQVLGYEVDAINSVQLSNHTKYKHFKGQILNSEELEAVFDGLRKNEIIKYTHLLTGYCSSLTFLNKVCDLAGELKEANPDMMYLCDPVLGDNGVMYVPPALLDVYRDKLIPLADAITPNHYETELLTGTCLKSESEVLKAIGQLHDLGVPTVVVSSVPLGDDNDLYCYASEAGQDAIVKMKIPQIPAHFTGTGDLFSALFMAWFSSTKDLKISVERSINTLYSVLLKTLDHAQSMAAERGSNEPSFFELEMRLVQSKKIIENPPQELKAEEIVASNLH